MSDNRQSEWTPPRCPDDATAYHQEALKLAQEGRLPEAKRLLCLAVELRPGNSSAQLNLGMIYHQLKELPEAIEAYQAALRAAPDLLRAWVNLSSVQALGGNVESAQSAAERATALAPYDPVARRALAHVLKIKGDFPGAAEAQQRAVALENDPVLAAIRESVAARAAGQIEAAWEHAQRGLQHGPQHPQVHCQLGDLCLDMNQLEQAIVSYYRAAELDPKRAELWAKLGHGFMFLNSTDEAKAAYQCALSCDPDYAEARYNSAWAHLLSGDYTKGWPGFAERWNSTGPRYANFPVWRGEPIDGKTLLLYGEHGFGDTVHFSRYAELVARRGGRVVLECQPQLKGLMRSVPGVSEAVGFGEPVPRFDLQASLFDLPMLFQTELETVPHDVPYLSVPSDVAVDVPSVPETRLKVGLVWSSSSMLFWKQSRSIPLRSLAPLLSHRDVAFYSLQFGPEAAQLKDSEWRDRIVDLGPQLSDFGSTAAAMAQMDLLIVVDTSAAHLAGALGKPTWLLLVCAPDWRWLLERKESIWYPTFRLFRQNHRHSWANVVEELKQELEQFLAKR